MDHDYKFGCAFRAFSCTFRPSQSICLQKTSSDDADVNSPRAAAASDEALSPGQSEARSESPVESEQAEEADEDFDEEEEEDAEMEEEEPPKKEPAKNRSHKKAPLVTKGPKKGGKLPGRKHSVRDGLAKPLALDVASM